MTMTPPPFARLAVTLALPLLITACGGGGGGGSSSTATGSNATASSTTGSAAAAAVTTDSSATTTTASTTTTAAASTTIAAGTDSNVVLPASVSAADQIVSNIRRTAQSATNETAPGNGYFVDSVNGSDSNPGTFAAPFKSLSKLTALKLQAGQNIYLRCGSVFRESLTLSWDQLLDNTVIAGYGPACGDVKATITGADDFSKGWTKNGNVWSRRVPAGTPKISRLFVRGETMRTAQWPNFGGVGHEYAISSSATGSSNTSLAAAGGDIGTLSSKDIVGASMKVRSDSYWIEDRVVQSYDASSGNFALVPTTGGNTLEGGDGYVLQDKLWMLDAAGEFFHDTTNNMLYVYPTQTADQADLNSASVEGSVRDTALHLVNRSNMVLASLALINSRVDGLFLDEVPNTTVIYVEASNNGQAGIEVKGSPGSTITRTTVLGNWLYGIYATWARNVNILSNYVNDTGMIGYAGNSLSAVSAGPGTRVEGNDIQRTAFNAITFSGTGGTTVINNDVSRYCIRLSDCAAIYTWNGPDATTNPNNQSSFIQNNRILGATPNPEGAVAGSSDIVVGVYLDDYSKGSTVSGNSIYGMPMGLYVHNGSNHTISNNKIWMTSRVALWANSDATDADHMTGNVFSNNQLAPVQKATGAYPALPTFINSAAIWYRNIPGGVASLTNGGSTFTGNQIVELNGTGVESAWIRTATDDLHLTANGWRNTNPKEQMATSPATFSVYKPTLGAEVLNKVSFNTGFGDWGASIANASLGGSLTTASLSGCASVCAVFNASSYYDMLNSPSFAVNPSMPYVYSFKAVYTGNATVYAWIGRNGTPWDNMAQNGYYASGNASMGSAGDTIQQELIFTPKSSDASRANIQMATFSVPVGIDTVSLKPLLGYSTSAPSDYVAVGTAYRDAPVSVDCGMLGWPSNCQVIDGDGNAVTLPTTLPTGTTKLFLRTDSAWKR